MNEELSKIDSDWLRRFRAGLRRWHKQHGRELPWRNCRDPYRVWISEIMLQQTTVAAVKPYFERFMQRFPDVGTLASADEEAVLRLWEGLGYYSRARNLHRAAKTLMESHNGSFPQTIDELLTLPGIGRYTAGAIRSFGFDLPAPIVEANTLRLYSRLLGFRGDPRSAVGQKMLWSFAEMLVPQKEPGEFNQALTDLGATVCTPTEPDCNLCPVALCCRALVEQSQAEIPRAAQRPEMTEVHESTVAVESRGKFLLLRQPKGVRWAGLWDFPRFASSSPTSNSTPFVEQRIATDFGLEVRIVRRVVQIKHTVTRYRITLDCWLAKCASARDLKTQLEHAWVSGDDFTKYPLSTTGRKLANLLGR